MVHFYFIKISKFPQYSLLLKIIPKKKLIKNTSWDNPTIYFYYCTKAIYDFIPYLENTPKGGPLAFFKNLFLKEAVFTTVILILKIFLLKTSVSIKQMY